MAMPPIQIAPLFPEISRHLVALLRSLTPDEWRLPTVSSRRQVKDIATHLLDGSLRRLSMQRDGYDANAPETRPQPGETLVAFLTRLNDDWEVGTRRLSPRVLTDLIEWADRQLADLFGSLDPEGPAIFPVAWAGEEQSRNWMDVARDYTEKWHHTQQIFDATGRTSSITSRHLFHPCLDIFCRALPYTYRDVSAPDGTVVTLAVTGEAGGEWHIRRGAAGWEQLATTSATPAARVTMDQETAWKLVTKRRPREAALQQFPGIEIAGDESLGGHLLDMVSVMA